MAKLFFKKSIFGNLEIGVCFSKTQQHGVRVCQKFLNCLIDLPDDYLLDGFVADNDGLKIAVWFRIGAGISVFFHELQHIFQKAHKLLGANGLDPEMDACLMEHIGPWLLVLFDKHSLRHKDDVAVKKLKNNEQHQPNS